MPEMSSRQVEVELVGVIKEYARDRGIPRAAMVELLRILASRLQVQILGERDDAAQFLTDF